MAVRKIGDHADFGIYAGEDSTGENYYVISPYTMYKTHQTLHRSVVKCNSYRLGGCLDWVLPSVEDIEQIVKNAAGSKDKTFRDIMPFSKSVKTFWTSTGDPSNSRFGFTYTVDNRGVSIQALGKSTMLEARAIRKLPIPKKSTNITNICDSHEVEALKARIKHLEETIAKLIG